MGQELVKVDLANLPSAKKMLLKYGWTDEAQVLLLARQSPYPDEENGDLKGLYQLAIHCQSAGLDNAEMYSVLLDAMGRWGVELDDYHAALIEVISLIRGKESPSTLEVGKTETMGYMTLLNSDFKIDWIFDNFLTESGVIAFAGEPGLGKTQLMIMFCTAAALGREFLGFKFNLDKPQKVLFLSLEMGPGEIKDMLIDMVKDLTEEEQQLVEENFQFHALGNQLYLNLETDMAEYWRLIGEHKPDGVVIDSWSQAVLGELSSDAVTRNAMNFINTARRWQGCWFGIINHTNKPPQDANSKQIKQESVFGSRFFTSNCSLVVMMVKGATEGDIEVHIAKNRFAKRLEKPIVVRRTAHLNFDVISGSPQKQAAGSGLSSLERKAAKEELTKVALTELAGLGEYTFIQKVTGKAPEHFDPSLLEESDGGPIPGFGRM